MQIKWETILDAFTYNGKILVCQIKFVTKNGNNFLRNNDRCVLSSQQWQAFDEKLAEIVGRKNLDGKWSHNGYSFQLCDGDLNVNVTKSKLSSQALCECLCLGQINAGDISWMLECRIERQTSEEFAEYQPKCNGGVNSTNAYVASATSKKTKDKDIKHIISEANYSSDLEENGIYSPKPLINACNSANDKLLETTIIPEYQPAPIKAKSIIDANQPSIKNYILLNSTKHEDSSIKANDETEYVPSKIVQLEAVVEEVPQYVPTPISCLENEKSTSKTGGEANRKLSKSSKSTHKKSSSKHIPGSTSADRSSNKNSHRRHRNEKLKNHSKTGHKSADGKLVSDKEKIPTIAISSDSNQRTKRKRNEKAINSIRQQSSVKMKSKSKEREKHKVQHSSDKTDDEYKSTNTKKEIDIKSIHRELFGSDDNDDDMQEENISTKSSISRSGPDLNTPPRSKNKDENQSLLPTLSIERSAKKNRKRQLAQDCEQEKRTLNKWLNQTESNKSMKINVPILNRFEKSIEETLSDMEILPTMYDHLSLNNYLNNLKIPSFKKVKYLSLKHLQDEEVQNTFDKYKPYLDAIYEKYHTTHYVKDHDGIDHCFVINLINESLQRQMLNKLSDIYFSLSDTSHATMYVNAMLPEWIIRIFMSVYKFSREEAIHHVKCQHAYKLYEESLLDNSFEYTD